MKLFDLHCDTLFEMNKGNKNLAVSFKGMQKFEKCTRAFAIFVPDGLSDIEAREHFNKLYSIYKNDILEKAVMYYNVKPLLTIENASFLASFEDDINLLSDINVKALSFTWNGENNLGFGQLKNKGLKDSCKKIIKKLENTDIVIDVSHLSDKGFEDVCSNTEKTFIATHSNSRKICNHNRNLTDEQILEIIKRNGLIGLNFYPPFLNDSEKATLNDILSHAEHILSLGGENVLSIGTDFDGAEVIEEFNNDEKLTGLYEFFINNGFKEEITNKILFENAERFFVNLS